MYDTVLLLYYYCLCSTDFVMSGSTLLELRWCDTRLKDQYYDRCRAVCCMCYIQLPSKYHPKLQQYGVVYCHKNAGCRNWNAPILLPGWHNNCTTTVLLCIPDSNTTVVVQYQILSKLRYAIVLIGYQYYDRYYKLITVLYHNYYCCTPVCCTTILLSICLLHVLLVHPASIKIPPKSTSVVLLQCRLSWL